MKQALLYAAMGTFFTFAMTALGSSVVFFFRKEINQKIQRIFLGFAAGVMTAASVWSLLIPAVEEAEKMGKTGWIPALGGFLLGALFLMAMNALLPHLHLSDGKVEGMTSSFKRTTLLIFAVTLHNIPEGMAVGLAFALSAQHGSDLSFFTSAMVLALGMGIQNFPEGAAISLPLRREGVPSGKAFIYGSLSGLVELIFGVLVVLVFSVVQPLMPWMLAFAAGAMMFVVVEELIPEAHLGEHSNSGTLGVMAGFTLMMVLDVALG